MSVMTALWVITYADNGQSFMTENSVVLDDIARPVWPTVSNSLRQLQSGCFKLGDRLVTFMTGKDSAHVWNNQKRQKSKEEMINIYLESSDLVASAVEACTWGSTIVTDVCSSIERWNGRASEKFSDSESDSHYQRPVPAKLAQRYAKSRPCGSHINYTFIPLKLNHSKVDDLDT